MAPIQDQNISGEDEGSLCDILGILYEDCKSQPNFHFKFRVKNVAASQRLVPCRSSEQLDTNHFQNSSKPVKIRCTSNLKKNG